MVLDGCVRDEHVHPGSGPAVVKPLKYSIFMKCRRVMETILLSWAIPIGFITIESCLLLSIQIPVINDIFIWLVMIFYEFRPSIFYVNILFRIRVLCKHV